MSRRCYRVWDGLARRRRKEQRLVLFHRIVNKIACIQTGSILAFADSQTRANLNMLMFWLTVSHSDTPFFQQQFLTETASRLA